VNGNIEAGGFLEAVERFRESEHVLIVAGEGAAENGDDADGVFVANCRGALRVGDNVVPSSGTSRASTSQ
jgi:hypothetical protein